MALDRIPIQLHDLFLVFLGGRNIRVTRKQILNSVWISAQNRLVSSSGWRHIGMDRTKLFKKTGIEIANNEHGTEECCLHTLKSYFWPSTRRLQYKSARSLIPFRRYLTQPRQTRSWARSKSSLHYYPMTQCWCWLEGEEWKKQNRLVSNIQPQFLPLEIVTTAKLPRLASRQGRYGEHNWVSQTCVSSSWVLFKCLLNQGRRVSRIWQWPESLLECRPGSMNRCGSCLARVELLSHWINQV